jgi:hypothetical protein
MHDAIDFVIYNTTDPDDFRLTAVRIKHMKSVSNRYIKQDKRKFGVNSIYDGQTIEKNIHACLIYRT